MRRWRKVEILSLVCLCAGFGEPETAFGGIQVLPSGMLSVDRRETTHVRTDLSKSVVTVSERGRAKVLGRLQALGPDDFVVVNAELRIGSEPVRPIADTLGSGLYLADSGWLASVARSEHGKAAVLRLYGPDGRRRAEANAVNPQWFAHSEDGRVFAAAGTEATVVLDGARGAVLLLPAAQRVFLDSTGQYLLLVRGLSFELRRWERLLFRCAPGHGFVRDAAFLLRRQLVAILFAGELKALDISSGRSVWSFRGPPGKRFRQILARGDTLFLGVQTRLGETLRGELWVVDLGGRILEVRRGARTVPARATSLRGRPQGENVPWPFEPFDRPLPLGNTYEEYQNYGGEPYLHPGVDMLVAPRSRVYAVADGFVKARLTISGGYHWRIAVADEAGADTTEGWLYAHLVPETIAFEVGDTVRAGDYLGQIVPWPVAGFHHLHFVKVRQGGVVWSRNWAAAFNPLDVLQPQSDSTAPFFEPMLDGRLVAYTSAETGQLLPPDSLCGRVQAVVRVADRVNSDVWNCSVYELRYWLVDLSTGRVALGPVLAARLSHRLPDYTGGPELTRVLYADTPPFQSRGDYAHRVFYHILTHTDGDARLELSDGARSLDLRTLHPGPYQFHVLALDAAGNRTEIVDSVNVVRYTTSAKVSAGGERLPRNLTLRTRPNPFSSTVVLIWSAPRSPGRRLEIFDVLGRRVAIHELTSAANAGMWTWDGRDRWGRPVPSGIYLCRLTAAGRSVVTRLLRLR